MKIADVVIAKRRDLPELGSFLNSEAQSKRWKKATKKANLKRAKRGKRPLTPKELMQRKLAAQQRKGKRQQLKVDERNATWRAEGLKQSGDASAAKYYRKRAKQLRAERKNLKKDAAMTEIDAIIAKWHKG